MTQRDAHLATACPNMFRSRYVHKARSHALGACLLAFCLLLPTVLLAWGSIGHMTVAYLAYHKLTPATKARVRGLLKLNPDYAAWEKQVPIDASSADRDQMIFMIAATWADDIKGDAKYSDDGPDPNTPDGASSSENIGYTDLFRHRYWHFIDTPYYIDSTRGYATPTPNAQTQIAAFRTVLASTQSDDLKSYDLVWLLHLIGDIHQPLHATTRVSTGITGLDEMMGGKGFFRGSSVLVSGSAGTGKSSIAARFASAACARGESCLYFAFEESPSQIIRNMRSVGIDLEPSLQKRVLHFHAVRPTSTGLEGHLAGMQKMVKSLQPDVVVVDPITSILSVSGIYGVKSMLTRLVDFLKVQQITSMFTNLTFGTNREERTEEGVSSLMDTWIVLSDDERNGRRTRGLYVVKSRGMAHSRELNFVSL